MSYPPFTPASRQEPPKHLPLYGASLTQAVARFFTKYAVFSGRASRSEYWWVQLASALLGLALSVVFTVVALGVGAGVGLTSSALGAYPDEGTAAGTLIGGATAGVVVLLYVGLLAIALALLIPSIAVCVRRLHDAGFSGWWYLLNLIPGGSIAVLIFTIMPSVAEGARFDDPPFGYPHPPNAPYLYSGYTPPPSP